MNTTQQPYTAEFTTIITGILAGDVGELKDVVKKVNFTVRGKLGNQVFELPQTCDLTPPESADFSPVSTLTEQQVISWVEANFDNWPGVKSHIQYVLDQEVVKAALESKPLPWVPVTVPETSEA